MRKASSAYTKTIHARMNKLITDYIKGGFAGHKMNKKVITRTPHSTVEQHDRIYDYLGLLFARAGENGLPVSGGNQRMI